MATAVMTYEDSSPMADDFELFSMIGMGKSVSPRPQGSPTEPAFEIPQHLLTPPSAGQVKPSSPTSKPSAPPASPALEKKKAAAAAAANVKRRRALSMKQRPALSRESRETLSADNLHVPRVRARVNSMPMSDENDNSEDTTTRVRQFQTRGNSIKNRGDMVVSQSKSNSSLHSSGSSASSSHTACDSLTASSSRLHAPLSLQASGGSVASGDIFTTDDPTYNVLLLGAEGVGKTALTCQFLTSDDVCEAEGFDDGTVKTVPVMLDGTQSILLFMDQDYNQNVYDPSSANAYIVVYSITDESSFADAESTIHNLRHFEKDKAIILVGNKADLVRKRMVPQSEGTRVAKEFDTKFVETSTVLNHEVDHLLVGILRQIKLQLKRNAQQQTKSSGAICGATSGSREAMSPRASSKAEKDNSQKRSTSILKQSFRGLVNRLTPSRPGGRAGKDPNNLLS